MSEDVKTAETTVSTEIDSHADIDQSGENVNDATFTDTPEGKQKDDESSVSEMQAQTMQQNSQNARRRRELELKRAEQAAQAAREKAIIEVLGGKNPFTGEEMKDSTDVEEYLLMKEIEKNGGDPLVDFSKFHKTREREKAAKNAEAAAKNEWYRKDREEFASKYPEVNLEMLIQDKQFQLFAGGKVGTMPLAEIYEGFIEVVSQYEQKAKQHAKQLYANSKSTPGALSSPNAPDSGFFTREQVQKMSQEEVHRNYDKIRASMTKWK